MHLDIHYAIFKPSQTALASWQIWQTSFRKKLQGVHRQMTLNHTSHGKPKQMITLLHFYRGHFVDFGKSRKIMSVWT